MSLRRGVKKRCVSLTAHSARKILKFLERRKSSLSPLLILTHDYPDPDALASAVCLHYIAEKKFRIESRVVFGGIIGRMENRAMVNILKLPVHKIKAADFKKYPHVALMDTQPDFENNSFPKDREATIVIDQHPSVTKPSADLVIVDTECAATSVILAEALLMLKIEIPEMIATALAYGILSDTLNLYRSGRPDVVQTYLDLLPFCNLKALARIQNPPRSRKFFATLAHGIRLALVGRGLIYSHLGFVESPDLVAQIADFLLTYKNIRWSLCTGRFNGKLHVSFRTAATQAQAAEILRDAFWVREEAGGHDTIAGGSFKVGKNVAERHWQEAEESFVQRLRKRLRIPRRSECYLPFREKNL